MEAVLELDDIQGYIIRGYAHMQYSRFVLLNITDAVSAKQWLGEIESSVTTAKHIPDKAALPHTNLNIAFTSKGLYALGMLPENAATFNPAFREGMITPHRQRILGDEGTNAPKNWIWGGTEDAVDKLHVLLMVFGRDKETCLNYYEGLRSAYTSKGFTEIKAIDGQTLPKNKEHFGFRDGISQPAIKGSGKAGLENDTVNAGEFILGYKNEYNVYPDSPLLSVDQGNMNLLSADAEGSGKKDLGRNGSYLVMRQMEQDVNKFWTFMNERTRNKDGSINEKESIKLAAKMMGRWPSGAPVTKFPDQDPNDAAEADDNDFGYADNDKDGAKCPFGSHLRRCNPRDSFEDINKKQSLNLTSKHRIIRRARLYGNPFEGSPLNKNPEGEVGLLFNCFNADFARQYELVQHTWANSPKVYQLYNDPDPIIGVRENANMKQQQNFTIQGCPVNKTINNLQQFVTIKGGAYFFFPSITAIRYLASL